MTATRSATGVLAGLLAGGGVVAAAELSVHAVLSGDGVFGGVAIGYGLGALAGTAATAAISGRAVATAIPVALAGLAALNLASIPHPIWFAPLALVALAIGWWAGRAIPVGRANIA